MLVYWAIYNTLYITVLGDIDLTSRSWHSLSPWKAYILVGEIDQ